MIRPEELLRAARQGKEEVVQLLDREAQRLGGSFLLVNVHPRVMTERLVLHAKMMQGFPPIRQGALHNLCSITQDAVETLAAVEGAGVPRWAQSDRALYPVVDPTEENSTAVGGWIATLATGDGLEIPVAPVRITSRDDLWPSTQVNFAWSTEGPNIAGIAGFNTRGVGPGNVTLTDTAQVGVKDTTLRSVWFEEGDDWRMEKGTNVPWILATPHVAVLGGTIENMIQVMIDKRMAAANCFAILINRMFEGMRVVPPAMLDTLAKILGRKGSSLSPQERGARTRMWKSCDDKRTPMVQRVLGNLDGELASLRDMVADFERTAARVKEGGVPISEGLKAALDAGIIEDARVNDGTVRILFKPVDTLVTQEMIQLAQEKGKPGPPGGPGIYRVNPFVVQMNTGGDGSTFTVYTPTLGAHAHPHLMGGNRPCLGHQDEAERINKRTLDVLWARDIPEFCRWVAHYMSSTNLERGYDGIWKCATRIGDLPKMETRTAPAAPTGRPRVRVVARPQ